MNTPSTDPACWLNGALPRAAPQNTRETTAMLTSIPKENQAALNAAKKGYKNRTLAC